jgi:hypothetical protein
VAELFGVAPDSPAVLPLYVYRLVRLPFLAVASPR